MNQAPKSVLYVITKATWGGAQRYVFDLATHLPHEQFRPIVAYGQSGKLSDDLKRAGIATYEILSLQRDVALWSDIASFFAIVKCIRKLRPDVVHLNSSKAAALGALAARLCGVKKIIFTIHGWPFKENRGSFVRAAIYFLSWFTALLSTAVICVCEEDLRLATHMSFIGHKAHLIYNGIDLGMQFGSGDVIRNAFPKGVRITGTIGELIKNKNQIALVEGANNDSTMYVAIVGEGEDRMYLTRKIKEYGLQSRVKLFGFMPASEVLRGFDVFALPSIKEGLPYVLLEAKAAGLPIVANRVGGVGEILDAKDLTEFSLAEMIEKTLRLYQ